MAKKKKQTKKLSIKPLTDGCNGVPMPTSPPAGHTLGHWYCTKDGWQWEDEIG